MGDAFKVISWIELRLNEIEYGDFYKCGEEHKVS
jgi:hypothetical protein